MYEILKQYERIGERVIPVVELKNLLGIEPSEYPRYGDFRRWVLDSCQAALSENTDIAFTYEPFGRKGRGGKIMQLRFIIQKNEGFIDPVSLVEFIRDSKDAKK